MSQTIIFRICRLCTKYKITDYRLRVTMDRVAYIKCVSDVSGKAKCKKSPAVLTTSNLIKFNSTVKFQRRFRQKGLLGDVLTSTLKYLLGL
jgi:hypothetical protein